MKRSSKNTDKVQKEMRESLRIFKELFKGEILLTKETSHEDSSEETHNQIVILFQSF